MQKSSRRSLDVMPASLLSRADSSSTRAALPVEGFGWVSCLLSTEKSRAMQGGAAYLLHLHVGGGAGRVFQSRMKSVP